MDDIVADLNGVAPYEWESLLTQRVSSTLAAPPLAGIERGGWRLAYADTPSDLQEAWQREWSEAIDLSSSIGILLKDDGTVVDVVPGKPAERAGVAPGMRIIAVNARRCTVDRLRAAIAATKSTDGRLELLVENVDYFQAFTLDYRDGEKYARLERDACKPDLLAQIIAPLTPATSKGSGPGSSASPSSAHP